MMRLSQYRVIRLSQYRVVGLSQHKVVRLSQYRMVIFPKGINSRYISSSSGKLNSFMKVGVPCVVSRLPGLRWLEKSGAGVVIDTPTQVTEAVKLIDASYAEFCDSALAIFNERLQFDASFHNVLVKMDAA